MASDRKQYEKAVEKWTNFQNEGVFSAPQEEGIVAVITSDYQYNFIRTQDCDDFNPYKAMTEDEIDIENFNREAKIIVEKLGLLGVVTELLTNCDIDHVTDAVRDINISDIVFIGHGALAGIFIKGANDDFFDWKQASDISTHLKTGSITQRQCGIQPRKFNPTLGMFLTSDLTLVRAAKGIVFDPKGNGDVENQLIEPVFNMKMPPNYRWIKENFPEKH
jgi:hypothetical protein